MVILPTGAAASRTLLTGLFSVVTAVLSGPGLAPGDVLGCPLPPEDTPATPPVGVLLGAGWPWAAVVLPEGAVPLAPLLPPGTPGMPGWKSIGWVPPSPSEPGVPDDPGEPVGVGVLLPPPPGLPVGVGFAGAGVGVGVVLPPPLLLPPPPELVGVGVGVGGGVAGADAGMVVVPLQVPGVPSA
jgi:hypothetical protein